ncbi:MAG: class I SAM-dependent methyltransferase [Thermoanaerobaculia bacterium]
MSEPAFVRDLAGEPERISVRRSLLDQLARRLLFSRLERLAQGRVVWSEAGEPERTFGPGGRTADGNALASRVRVHDPRAYRQIVFGGTIGAADAYTDGLWSASDLPALIRIMARQREIHSGLDRGVGRAVALVERAAHALRRNSRRGSRRNIEAHYDLGNDFFASFLDETMMYSCALFEHTGATLEEASLAKLDLVCRKLELSPGDRVIEIGTGWGGFALHAATKYGCRVVTTTISPAQRELAARRFHEAGVADRIELLDRDYRDLPALGRRFPKLVSIEMIEAVGERYLTRYLETVAALLEPGGRALIQAITVPYRLYADYRRGADFIQRRVFPGSFLPSVADLLARTARATDLELGDLEELTPHYATTLRHWRERLTARAPELRRAGTPERLLRLWEFYFSYCEGGFAERVIGDVHLLFRRPGAEVAA